MAEQGLGFDSVHFSDLTAGQYFNLLDLAQLALSQRTIEVLLPRLALRLHHALNFDIVTLGLYDSSAESIRLNVYKAGEAERRCECLPVHACASGWAWKNQRSVLIQDLDTQPKLPSFLRSLRQLGVRTYYVFPLTTRRHKLGAIGFGSSHVISKTNATLEFLRRAAAIIAELLDTKPSSDVLTVPTDCPPTSSASAARRETEPKDFDLRDYTSPDEAFQEMVGNSAPLQEV